MVLTRAQLDSLSKEKFSNITDQLQSLAKRFNGFIEKYDVLHSELLVSKNCNSLLRSSNLKGMLSIMLNI